MYNNNEPAQKIDPLIGNIEEVIKSNEGIIGYILRSTNSASVNLKDSTKIIDYAILSDTSFEQAQEILTTLELGQTTQIVLEGKNTKVLLTSMGDDRLSIFMQRNVDHNQLRKALHLT